MPVNRDTSTKSDSRDSGTKVNSISSHDYPIVSMERLLRHHAHAMLSWRQQQYSLQLTPRISPSPLPRYPPPSYYHLPPSTSHIKIATVVHRLHLSSSHHPHHPPIIGPQSVHQPKMKLRLTHPQPIRSVLCLKRNTFVLGTSCLLACGVIRSFTGLCLVAV